MIKINIKIVTLISIIAFFIFPSDLYSDTKVLRIAWEAEDGAIKYDVQIAGKGNNIIFKKSTRQSHVNFSLPPGIYKFRLRVTNKFYKTSEWSDWSRFKIAMKVASQYRKGLFGIGMKIGGGVPYFQVLSDFSEVIENSSSGFTALTSFCPGDTRLFKPPWFLRNIGFELETTFISFTGKEVQNKTDVDSNIKSFGGNLFFTTGFNFPLNLLIKVGGGLALTTLSYNTTLTDVENKTLNTQDPYYKVGGAIEFSYYYFFIDAGVDYVIVDYIGDKFTALRYYGMAGIRL